MWLHQETLTSKEDRTIKHIFTAPTLGVAEVSYIDKQDQKDILCVPTQTSCKLGCQFCHLTDLDIPVRSFSGEEITDLVRASIARIGLPRDNNTLLVSYMGSGEPLANITGVMESAALTFQRYHTSYDVVRFAVASIVPSARLLEDFTYTVINYNLNFKFHWSLHTTDSKLRTKLMPKALPVEQAVVLVNDYVRKTSNQAEAHYTLMSGINDRPEDIEGIARLLGDRPIPIKLLRYSERASQNLKSSQKAEEFQRALQLRGLKAEVYSPPGHDIGSSCGQFLTGYYEKYAPRKPTLLQIPLKL